ncbi:ABC transporter permease [Thermus tengchongensis]|uniref:ABC transporter permease n=1 Tax=Thermus tengchongensis TaxID=1214928 RepID=A0A4Y9FEI0_9DEIN|nr:ABC transporter permease [Thermus tengchongensis]
MTHSPPFGRAPVAAWPWLLAGLLALPLLALFLRGFPALPGTAKDLDVVLTSLLLATAGSLITLALALGLAVLGVLGGVGRTLEALLLLGYLVPPFVTGIGVLFSLQAFGVRIYGVPGILLAWALHYAPLAYLLLKPQVRVAMGLLAAARVHGVGGAKALRVFLPPLLPPLLVAGGTLYLALLGNFGVPAVLGLPERVYVLPTLAYARLLSPTAQDPLGEAAALGLWLGLLALPVVLLGRAGLLEAKESLLPPARPAYRLLFALYALLALLLVLLGLLREALLNPYTGAWDPVFAQALDLPLVQKGLRNSLLLALGATLLLLLLALALRPFPGLLRRVRGVLDLHYLLPGTLLGVGLILLLAPTPLYATPWLLLLAYLLNFAALALRALEGGLGVEGAVLAGRVHGLGRLRAWLRIGYPLLLPSAFAGAFLIFPLAFAEITLSALLYAPGAETIGVAVLSALNGGLYREASALGLVLMAFSALALLGRPRW